MWENINRGTEIIGGKTIHYRSNWEKNYGYYLQWLKEIKEIKDWEYEPLPRYEFIVKEGERYRALSLGYLPDFKVVNNDGSFYLVELKGAKQGMMKLKRMKKYYKDVKIELITSKEYSILKKKVGRMLNFS